MSGSTAFAMIDVEDPETPLWNQLLAEFRPRLVEAGVLYTGSVEVEQPPGDDPGQPTDPEPAADPGQPVEPQPTDPEQVPDPEHVPDPEQTPAPDPTDSDAVAALSGRPVRPGPAWQTRAPW